MESSEPADLANRGANGSHCNYVHPQVTKPITISGQSGDDATAYL